MEWISVKDRLPEIGRWALAYSWRGPIIASYFNDGWYALQVGVPGIKMEIKDVSHWMPLPEDPKQSPIERKEVVKYFIERIDTHEWWFIETDYTKPNFITTFNGSRIRTPGYQTVDGWTNDPLKAYAFDKREKAEYMIMHDVASMMPEQLMVTEHLFE